MVTEADVVRALRNRLPKGADAAALAKAYLAAASDAAAEVTAGPGPAPTTVAAQRAALVMAVCARMGRLLSAGEITALLRVPRSTARSTLTAIRATYTDDLSPLLLTFALEGACSDRGGEHGGVKGWRLVIDGKERFDALVEALDRDGTRWSHKRTDEEHDYVVVVEKGFDPKPFGVKSC